MAVVVRFRSGWFLVAALLAALAGPFWLVEPAAAATITVTNANDTTTPGDGVSLREAITSINSSANLNADVVPTGDPYGTNDTILFNIPGAGPHVISVGSALPDISRRVTIDGLSQGSIACPLPAYPGTPGPLAIQIHNGGAVPQGLRLLATGSRIRGLSITSFQGVGIQVDADSFTVTCSYLGVAADGSTPGNNFIGIRTNNGQSATIGGPNPGEGNLIANNSTQGLNLIVGSGHLVQGNTIRNNAVGLRFSSITNPSNNAVLQDVIRDNTDDGVRVESGTGNRISQNSIVNNGTTAPPRPASTTSPWRAR